MQDLSSYELSNQQVTEVTEQSTASPVNPDASAHQQRCMGSLGMTATASGSADFSSLTTLSVNCAAADDATEGTECEEPLAPPEAASPGCYQDSAVLDKQTVAPGHVHDAGSQASCLPSEDDDTAPALSPILGLDMD